MSRRRVSPSTFIAVVATIVAISSTSAIASAYITGGMIKTRTITAGNIAKNTLTGVEINESKLGTVPTATTAAKLAGLPYTSYLRSTRIDSGTIDFVGAGSGPVTVFTDSRIGLRVSYQSPWAVVFTNTNATAHLTVAGVGFVASASPDSRPLFDLVAGASRQVTFQAVGITYGTFMVRREGGAVATTPLLQVTCLMRDDLVAHRLSCVGVG